VEENNEDLLEISPAKTPEPAYIVKRVISGEHCVLFVEDEIAIYTCCSEEEAKKVCGALNKAFKFGAESVLHKLNSFSLDQRRNFGIVWGNNSMNVNS
jgi:hypothetical protein